MKRKINKVFLILTILMLLFSINSKVYAWGDIISDGDEFINQGKQGEEKIDLTDLQDLSGFLYNVLLSAGVVIAVIIAIVLGIQFMMGGAEGQAKVKEMLIPFIVGCVVVFGGFGIWKIALSIGDQLGVGGYSYTQQDIDQYNNGYAAAEQWAQNHNTEQAWNEYNRIINQYNPLTDYWRGYINYLHSKYDFSAYE